jgi:UDP-N-acetylmuramoylalanine--D-glutamate ligase
LEDKVSCENICVACDFAKCETRRLQGNDGSYSLELEKMEETSRTELAGKRITVAGLGRFGGGIAVTRWLVEQGARVLLTDIDPAEKLRDSLRRLEGLPLQMQLGGHREIDFTDTDLVVASPAIPLTNSFLAATRSHGVPITTEIRLFIER